MIMMMKLKVFKQLQQYKNIKICKNKLKLILIFHKIHKLMTSLLARKITKIYNKLILIIKHKIIVY